MRTGLLQKDRLSRPDRLWLIKERLFLIILSRFAESSIEFSNELYDKKHILSFIIGIISHNKMWSLISAEQWDKIRTE